MKYYFSLQLRMLNRQLTDFGLHPVAGYFLLVLIYAGLSVYLFSKTEFAAYIYLVIAISFMMKLSETGRNGFMKTCFNAYDYYKIRMIENLLMALPFTFFLLFNLAFLTAASLMIISGILVIFNSKSALNFAIPTPFLKRPFEFNIGFRNTFYVIFFAYFITVMAVIAGNFNLGIFTLILILFVCMTYYAEMENEFYVWIFSLSPNRFLIHKIQTAILFSTLLCLPVFTGLSVFFPGNIGVLAGFQCLGYLYLITVVLAKYADFPNKINLPQVLVIAFSISFPPLLIGVIPFFYLKSVQKLNEILR